MKESERLNKLYVELERFSEVYFSEKNITPPASLEATLVLIAGELLDAQESENADMIAGE